MEEQQGILNTGLRGVTIASTRISDVDGKAGRLIYRGYLVKDLADRASFEEVAYLLLYEKLPGSRALEQFRSRLAAERRIPEEMVAALKTRPADSLPMDILQAGVSMLANHDPDIKEQGKEAADRMAVRLIAQFPVLLAAWERVRAGKQVVSPRTDLGHAANFLYMLTGEEPDDEIAHFMDVALVLHAEHSFNASTFAAREVASTRAHMYASVSAAVGSLSGDLHGGANVRVMQMLKRIGSVDAVEAYVNDELDAGRLLFGLGHAVYKTDDPRAHILAPMSERMCARIGEPQWYAISKELEHEGKEIFKQRKGIEIFTNVDFYSASLYYAMGIPIDFFTPVFAVSRVAGWTAHVIEEQYAGAAQKPALYRPESDYIGDYCGPEECTFVPLDER
ncbi:MAG: citrate (Si)-synthase [Deltaproteobacteria bacterium SG8_13]|nr:MAG: citrate (Si)-synthase [Deltaproteobacteria bacterium SG8_13]